MSSQGNICFAFGAFNAPAGRSGNAGRWFFRGGSTWSRNNLPAAIDRLFTKQPPLKDVYELVLGPTPDSYYIGYLDSDDRHYSLQNGLPNPHLIKYLTLDQATGFINYDVRGLRIAMAPSVDPANSAKGEWAYVFIDRIRNSMQWCGVPDPLATYLNDNGGALRTKLIALGVDGTYIVVNHDGTGIRTLKSYYNELESLLAGLPNWSGIRYISLSPSTGVDSAGKQRTPEYVLVMESGACYYRVEDTMSSDFHTVAQSLQSEAHRLSITSTPVSPISPPLSSPLSTSTSNTTPSLSSAPTAASTPSIGIPASPSVSGGWTQPSPFAGQKPAERRASSYFPAGATAANTTATATHAPAATRPAPAAAHAPAAAANRRYSSMPGARPAAHRPNNTASNIRSALQFGNSALKLANAFSGNGGGGGGDFGGGDFGSASFGGDSGFSGGGGDFGGGGCCTPTYDQSNPDNEQLTADQDDTAWSSLQDAASMDPTC